MTGWVLGALAVLAGAAPDAPLTSYDAGDYRRATAGFEALVSRTPDDASARYNLGNSLFKEGKLGRAVAQYQRAFDLRPRDSDIRFNLAFALRRAGESLHPPGVPAPVFAAFYLLSEYELAGLHWLGAWLALLLASLWVLREESRPRVLPWLLAAAAGWLACGSWWGTRHMLEPDQRGVVVKPTAEIRSGPGENFGVSFTAPEGRRVEVLAESGAWLEIGLTQEGVKGWVPADAVERL